jgi:hypothetical protein
MLEPLRNHLWQVEAGYGAIQTVPSQAPADTHFLDNVWPSRGKPPRCHIECKKMYGKQRMGCELTSAEGWKGLGSTLGMLLLFGGCLQ